MKKISIIFILALVFNCSKSSDDGGGNSGGGDPVVTPPSATTLVFPEENKECTEGTSLSATQSSVTFRWNESANTNSYDIVLKNIDTQSSTTISSTTNQKVVTLIKGTPYSWYVISKASGTTQTAQSPTWKFYNAGDGVQFYAPFPAEVVAPNMGANLTGVATVTLEWTGSDVDNDIASYDVLFETVTPPTTQTGSNQAGTSIDVNVTAGNVYYWRVITTDAEGNNSESEIFEFRVD